MASDEAEKLIDTLRLSEEQWQELSDKLDQTTAYGTGQRRHTRVAFRKLSQIAVAIQQPDKTWAKYIVRSRDLSSGGIGFIHGSFIHLGIACRVILKDVDNQIVCIEGTIRRCNLLQGRAHNIGVQFNDEINLARFVPADDADISEAELDAG